MIDRMSINTIRIILGWLIILIMITMIMIPDRSSKWSLPGEISVPRRDVLVGQPRRHVEHYDCALPMHAAKVKPRRWLSQTPSIFRTLIVKFSQLTSIHLWGRRTSPGRRCPSRGTGSSRSWCRSPADELRLRSSLKKKTQSFYSSSPEMIHPSARNLTFVFLLEFSGQMPLYESRLSCEDQSFNPRENPLNVAGDYLCRHRRRERAWSLDNRQCAADSGEPANEESTIKMRGRFEGADEDEDYHASRRRRRWNLCEASHWRVEATRAIYSRGSSRPARKTAFVCVSFQRTQRHGGPTNRRPSLSIIVRNLKLLSCSSFMTW